MNVFSPGERLALFVADGSADFFDRVTAAMSGKVGQIRRVHTIDDVQSASRELPAVAIVSVGLLDHDPGWHDQHDLRIIWIAEQTPGCLTRDPLGGHALLPPDFSAGQLHTMIEKVVPLIRTREMPRGPDGALVIARSRPMIELFTEVAAFADSDHNVLVEGETGVGKELVAQMLHKGHHVYSKGAFIAVNCGAIPDGLFESLFFGHTRGAFTGALQPHKGYLEQANGGTLFLDEIGELPLFQQVKLLRVLQSGDVTRVGSERSEHFNFRLVAATNRSLRDQVRQGSFRADLFYRLAVIELQVPNLEERGPADKIAIFEALLAHTLASSGAGTRIDIPQWLTDRVAAMRFPGNVRQLQNLSERVGVIVRQTGQWEVRLINRALEQVGQSESCPEASTPAAARPRMNIDERERILGELERNGWQRQKTAEQLGMSRKSLWEKIRRYKIGQEGLDWH